MQRRPMKKNIINTDFEICLLKLGESVRKNYFQWSMTICPSGLRSYVKAVVFSNARVQIPQWSIFFPFVLHALDRSMLQLHLALIFFLKVVRVQKLRAMAQETF